MYSVYKDRNGVMDIPIILYVHGFIQFATHKFQTADLYIGLYI